jgi:hypothetical protein
MQATDYIHPRIPALQVTEPSGTALRWMEELGVDTLPVSEEAFFMGFVALKFGKLIKKSDNPL